MESVLESKTGLKFFIVAVFRGLAQIMLQKNAVTGLFFLAGIAVNSVMLAISALAATIIGTLTAQALGYSKSEIGDGLYGFNGALVGIAVLVFFKAGVLTLIVTAAGAVFSAFLMHEMKKRVPAYTAPFVITTWIVLFFLKWLQQPEIPASAVVTDTGFDFPSMAAMGFGQVMFQPNIITGILFFVGILIHSRKAAGYALLGSVVGGLLALLLSFSTESVNNGIWGYNAVLCAVALGNSSLKNFVAAAVAIIFSVLLNRGLAEAGVITLTAPFVLATWILLLAGRYYNRTLTSPEDAD